VTGYSRFGIMLAVVDFFLLPLPCQIVRNGPLASRRIFIILSSIFIIRRSRFWCVCSYYWGIRKLIRVTYITLNRAGLFFYHRARCVWAVLNCLIWLCSFPMRAGGRT